MNNFENEDVTKKYKKMLNDLLNISRNDSCIFSNVNNKNIFDVQKKFGDKFFEKVISNETFLIPLTQTDNEYFVNLINKANSIEEIKNIYKEFDEVIPEELEQKFSNKKLITDIDLLKKEVIKFMEISKQKSAFEWKVLLNKAKSMNEQNNLWPIHLGFIYMTLKIDNKIVQAPMFFKEVNIKIKNSKVSIVSVGDIKINEKLVYFLESNNFLLDVDIDYSKMSIAQLFDVVKKSWSQSFTLPDTLKGFVPNFKENEINNESISFWPGISLGFFEPTGGHLRKIMLKILENNLLDKVLEVEFDKNIYKNRVRDSIFKKNFGFYKIVHSNLSQDKAVVSALNQNTIIWGPPGTGKSQTITNILTNILMFDKTALVVSQKRAALEVLKNRMESLEEFCLFILNDKEMNKKNFYEPIKEYITYLENFSQSANEKMIKIISDKEKELMRLINSIMKKEFSHENILLFSEFAKDHNYDEETLRHLLELDPNLKYNYKEISKLKPRKIGKYLMKENDIKKPNFFTSVRKDVKSYSNNIVQNLIDKNIDIDYYLSRKNKIDSNLWTKLHNLQINDSRETKSIINNHENLKILISKMIVEKIKKFDDNMKTKYGSFAMDVRSASLDPIVFIKKHIDIIKQIYPIIITTPETDLQGWDREEFDYALLDESSQIFLEKGIPILYLAKIKILAGDDQQMQPSRWFAAKVEGENPFGGIESLLDYAIAKGTYTLLLDKNYRSSFASLMSFNSQVFYKGELDVVDTRRTDISFQPIEVINVDGVWENSKNINELNEVIKQAVNNLNKFEKIILLAFNASQQTAIEELILESYPDLERAMDEGKLLIRNIENIQGDEADLLIVSIAYDKNTKLHSTYVAKPGGKNALNVAISRARDKMIIIKSIYSQDIQNPSGSEDIGVFKEWLKFLDLNEEERKNYKYYKNKINDDGTTERKINHSTVQISLTDLSASLVEKIKFDLSNDVIGFEDKFEIVVNYSIGTIKMPLAILDKKTGLFVLGLYLDNFDYWKSYNDYVIDKDVENFFRIKKYPLERVNHLNWNIKKQNIIDKINQFSFKLEKTGIIE